MTTWPDALDVYEASLVHHQRLVDGEVVDEANPWPPAELPAGPVPEPLQERATELLTRSFQVMDGMAAKMADVAPRKPSRSAYHPTPERPRWTATL